MGLLNEHSRVLVERVRIYIAKSEFRNIPVSIFGFPTSIGSEISLRSLVGISQMEARESPVRARGRK